MKSSKLTALAGCLLMACSAAACVVESGDPLTDDVGVGGEAGGDVGGAGGGDVGGAGGAGGAASDRIEKDKDPPEEGVFEEEGEQRAFVALDDLLLVGEDIDGELASLGEALAEVEATAFVAMLPGWGEGPAVFVDPSLSDVLLEGSPLDPEGIYSMVDVAFDDGSCLVVEVPPEDAKQKGTNKGICAHIAIAHSLVDNLDIVSEDWKGVLDGDTWGDDFLKRIIAGAGGERAPSWKGIEDTHTADWNSKWEVTETKTSDREQGDDCEELEEWCKELEKFVEVDDDDCLLKLYGSGSSHMMPIPSGKSTSVTFTKQSTLCHCNIETVDTGKQDPKDDLKGVPRRPGRQLWKISPHTINIASGSYRDRVFWNTRNFRFARYMCFGEFLKDGVSESAPEKPGKAFD